MEDGGQNFPNGQISQGKEESYRAEFKMIVNVR